MTIPTASSPRIDIHLSLDPDVHSYFYLAPPLLKLSIISRAETPITVFTWGTPLNLPRALTDKCITIINLATGESVKQTRSMVQRPALMRLKGSGDERLFLTLQPDTPVELSTAFGLPGQGVQPQPKSIDVVLRGYNRERKLKEVVKSRLAHGVDGLEPSNKYVIGLDHEALQKMRWTPVDREQILVSEAGPGAYVQDYAWEKSSLDFHVSDAILEVKD